MKKKSKQIGKDLQKSAFHVVSSLRNSQRVIKMPASEENVAWGTAESTGFANPSKVYTRSREQKGAPECVELSEK